MFCKYKNKQLISKILNIQISDNKIVDLDKKDENILINCLRNKYKKEINDYKNTLEILEYNKLIRKKDFDDYKINNLNKCQICYDSDIDTLIIPCGHTFCRKCIEKFTVCHYCRNEIDKLQKVIFM